MNALSYDQIGYWFSGSTHFTAIYIFIISPPYCLLSQICAPVVATPFVLVNEYLGTTIDWSTEGVVVFTMYDYLESILDEAPSVAQ